jgi:hypothetical protein
MLPKYQPIVLTVNNRKRIVKDILFMDDTSFVGNYRNHKIYIAKSEDCSSFQIEVVNPSDEYIVSGWHEDFFGRLVKTIDDAIELAIYEIVKFGLNEFDSLQFIDNFNLNFQTLLEQKGNVVAMGFLFEEIQKPLIGENFQLVNNVFNLMDFTKYHLTFLIGLLSATKFWSSQLKSRSKIIKFIRSEYTWKTLGEERIENLLKGLL